ncbi:hypothetical protein EDM57_04785 [Brevibacillus gelatini]|uniref:Uncharacterized protein n=1 Tax=Brevibacillus gelatini TaxID=1655277 RepID=A0A3M8B833_9BACL|nr:hypothetical protein EDM57_04785 [Brevibacillus gelatini]
MKCPNCGKEEMVRRWQPQFEYEQKVLKSGKLSKRKRFVADVTYAVPEWIQCLECGTEWDYVINDNGKIELCDERI